VKKLVTSNQNLFFVYPSTTVHFEHKANVLKEGIESAVGVDGYYLHRTFTSESTHPKQGILSETTQNHSILPY
jgi:hypothetical protein